MATFGTLALGLSGLIETMPLYPRPQGEPWWLRDVAFLATLLATAAAGATCGAPAATNTAYVFLSLWVSQHYFRFVFDRDDRTFVAPAVLFASSVLFYATLWLRSNPGFLASLLTLP